MALKVLPPCMPADQVPPFRVEVYPVCCAHHLPHETVGPLRVDDHGPVLAGERPDLVYHYRDQPHIVFVERGVVLDEEVRGITPADNGGYLVSGETTAYREPGHRAAESWQDPGKIAAHVEEGIAPYCSPATIQPVNYHLGRTGDYGDHPLRYDHVRMPFEVHMPDYQSHEAGIKEGRAG